ncbi:MAG: hypothetical protein Q8P07_04695 [bacterium]|nr:hypothetical protein [bacterium]
MKIKKFTLAEVLSVVLNPSHEALCCIPSDLGFDKSKIMVFMLNRSLWLSQISDARVIDFCRKELLRQFPQFERCDKTYCAEYYRDKDGLDDIVRTYSSGWIGEGHPRGEAAKKIGISLAREWYGRQVVRFGNSFSIKPFSNKVDLSVLIDDNMVKIYGPA